MSPLLIQSSTSFLLTLIAIVVYAKVALKLGMTDKPNQRKRHEGEIPLVGGLAIFTALAVGAWLWGDDNQTMITVNGNEALWVFMLGGAVLVVTGALDDRFHLGVATRILSEVVAAIVIIEGLDLRVVDLGNLVGLGRIHMPPEIAYPFTVVAVFGVINAFNMLDGIDGLLASLVLMTLVVFHLFTQTPPGFVSLFIGASLVAFLCSNLKLFPFIPKSFLGDAGSKLLGFIMVSLVLAGTFQQIGGVKLFPPVTALFIVGLPLYDMVFTTIRRALRGMNPMGSDRSHLHHLLLALGFSARRSLVLILAIGTAIPMAGLALHKAGTPELYQFAIFLGGFALYALLVPHAWRVARLLEAQQTSISVSFNTDSTGGSGAESAHAPSDKITRLHG